MNTDRGAGKPKKPKFYKLKLYSDKGVQTVNMFKIGDGFVLDPGQPFMFYRLELSPVMPKEETNAE